MIVLVLISLLRNSRRCGVQSVHSTTGRHAHTHTPSRMHEGSHPLDMASSHARPGTTRRRRTSDSRISSGVRWAFDVPTRMAQKSCCIIPHITGHSHAALKIAPGSIFALFIIRSPRFVPSPNLTKWTTSHWTRMIFWLHGQIISCHLHPCHLHPSKMVQFPLVHLCQSQCPREQSLQQSEEVHRRSRIPRLRAGLRALMLVPGRVTQLMLRLYPVHPVMLFHCQSQPKLR